MLADTFSFSLSDGLRAPPEDMLSLPCGRRRQASNPPRRGQSLSVNHQLEGSAGPGQGGRGTRDQGRLASSRLCVPAQFGNIVSAWGGVAARSLHTHTRAHKHAHPDTYIYLHNSPFTSSSLSPPLLFAVVAPRHARGLVNIKQSFPTTNSW